MKDQDVINRVIAGDSKAYGDLVDKYYRGLLNHLYLLVKEADVAEDLCQEAFIKAYYALDSYKPEYKFSTWLYRIGTNEGLKFLQRKRPVSLDDIPEQSDPYDPTEAARVEEREAQIRRAVSALPLRYQVAISLHYWQRLSYEATAEVMEVPVGTIKTWLHRAKTELKKILEEKRD